MSYLLPIRASSPVSAELLDYLAALTRCESVADIVVIDGSDPALFADFESRRGTAVRHVPVAADLRHLANGKVAGVLTGLRLAAHDCVVIADDDVRYDSAALDAVRAALDRCDIVRPQNYFDPLPWHACLDTARTLINRVTGGDWPGTFGLRRSALERTGGYDGNVLFENLELVRTVRAAGGRELRPLGLFVRRLPPPTHHFWSQRVRQAYDEFARPVRLVTSLALLPAAALLIARLHWSGVAVAIVVPLFLAETGRRIRGGVRVFPAVATLAAPFWLLERAVCAWVALAARLFLGGIPYRGRVMARAATPYQTLVRKHTRDGSASSAAPVRTGAGVS